jgi:isocitrate dehydrogenase kinase/phosphatase
MAAEPWFAVGSDDVYPEEFAHFLGVEGHLRSAFLERHSDLFAVATWKHWQSQVGAGELIDIFPYPARARLSG